MVQLNLIVAHLANKKTATTILTNFAKMSQEI